MSGTTRTQIIKSEVLIAYSHCPRTAFLLHCTEDRGTPNDFVRILEERARTSRTAYLATLQRTATPTCSYKSEAISSGAGILTEAYLEAANVAVYCDALRTAGQRGGPVAYEPGVVVGTYRVEKEQALNLSVVGYALQQIQGTLPPTGVLVTFDGECHRVNLRPLYKTVASILDHIQGWCKDPPMPPPPVVLNRHCPSCSFKNVCTEHAEGTDDLSLLDRMTPKAIGRYHDKGIFTVKQLSFIFKPRRRRRPRAAAPPPHHDFEVQALAIRTGKIYVQTVPEIQRSDVELFLDIEGVPDQQFSYLIGLLIREHQTIAHHAFWADTINEEESIWRMFVERAREHADAPIYHYGSYEARAIESLAKRFGPDVTDICKRLVNLNSQVYGKVYFPVRSNSLKVLGRFLGASWTEKDASGLQSLVWRYRWEMARSPEYKQNLVSYNAEDCQALRILTEELARLRTDAHSALNVDYVDQPKRNATDLGTELHAALDQVRLYANFDYRNKRICFRPEPDTPRKKGPGALKGHQGYERTVPVGRRTVIRVAAKQKCPKHEERLLKSGKTVEKVIVDLKFGKTGCKKILIRYSGEKRYCPECERYYEPPSIQRLGAQTFGHGFRAWAVYQRVILRLPYRMVTQAMGDLFHETAAAASIVNFVDSFGEYYRRTESALVKRLLGSPFIHLDETRLSIRGVDHYVWVFTDGQHVVFDGNAGDDGSAGPPQGLPGSARNGFLRRI